MKVDVNRLWGVNLLSMQKEVLVVRTKAPLIFFFFFIFFALPQIQNNPFMLSPYKCQRLAHLAKNIFMAARSLRCPESRYDLADAMVAPSGFCGFICMLQKLHSTLYVHRALYRSSALSCHYVQAPETVHSYQHPTGNFAIIILNVALVSQITATYL